MRLTVLLGAGGQLGTDLLATAGDRAVMAMAHADIDITDAGAVGASIATLRPDVIVNCAAFVDVERCETEPELAFAVNADAVRSLARAAKAADALLVHVSTDYVFDGTASSPYAEDAAPHPINVYGSSKLRGEEFMRETGGRHLIVRSSGLYGIAATRAKGNFVRTMLRLGRERGEVSVVTDQVLTPTSTADLARSIWTMVDGGAEGLYHATNGGECSWFEFARGIFEIAGMEVRVQPIESARLSMKAARPAYSVLDCSKLARDGFGTMRPWRDALAQHLARLAPLT